MKRKPTTKLGVLVLACAVGVLNAFFLIAVGYFFGKIDHNGTQVPSQVIETETKQGTQSLRLKCPPSQAMCVSIVKVPGDTKLQQYVLSFYNQSDETQTVIRPLDGSYYGWHQPLYTFSFLDAQGRELKAKKFGRCGNSGLWSRTSWPEDYVVEVAPGKSWETHATLPFSKIPHGAAYLRFDYTYNPLDSEAEQFPVPANASRAHWRALDFQLGL